MQLGRFIFGAMPDHEKVFIQIANDGEGGEFWMRDLPLAIQKLLNDSPTAQRLTSAGHSECDRLMWEFWKKKF